MAISPNLSNTMARVKKEGEKRGLHAISARQRNRRLVHKQDTVLSTDAAQGPHRMAETAYGLPCQRNSASRSNFF